MIVERNMDHMHIWRGPETELCEDCGRNAIVCPGCKLCTLCCFEAMNRG